MASDQNYRQWECQVCGDVYDEALGCPEVGVEPGTRFEDLPDDWTCPGCGSPKEDYMLIDE